MGANQRARGGQSPVFASLPPLPSGTGVELVCLWKFSFNGGCFANCRFCSERSMEDFAVLLSVWELPDVKRPSLLREAHRGNLRPETARRFRQRRGDGALLWIKWNSASSQQTYFCLGCIHNNCFFFSSRFLNAPEISVVPVRTDSCKGAELTLRAVSLPRHRWTVKRIWKL